MPPYTVEANGQTVHFDAPQGASQDQLKTLAARALKAAMPKETFARPVLEKRLREPATDQGSISATPWSLSGAITNKVAGALSAFGMDEGAAYRRADKVTGFLNDLTPVGAAVEGDQARAAFGEGRYGAALGHGALAALSAIPDGGAAAKAMFLGIGAKTVDRAAYNRAAKMEAELADNFRARGMNGLDAEHKAASDPELRQRIWNETGWFRGADKKWRFEVPDNEMTLDPRQFPNPQYQARRAANEYARKYYGADTFNHLPQGSPERGAAMSVYSDRLKELGSDMKVRGEDIIQHPGLFEAYPSARDIQVGQVNVLGLRGSWQDEANTLRLANDAMPSESRSTAAHELQHFVQGREGFARGGMVGTIPAHEVSPELAGLQQELQDALEEKALRADMRDPVTNRIQDEPAWHAVARRVEELQARLAKLQPSAEYEGYRRLAGEVEARNVQTRLDFTPEQRRQRAPWETEDVPRDQQFVIWYGR